MIQWSFLLLHEILNGLFYVKKKQQQVQNVDLFYISQEMLRFNNHFGIKVHIEMYVMFNLPNLDSNVNILPTKKCTSW